MTWSDVYLFCFLVGFSLSVLSFLAGAVHLHLPIKWHLPFHAHHHVGGMDQGGTHLSWFNASTILAFLAWFGGTGYILSTHTRLVALVCLIIASAAGLFAGWVVFRFMSRLLANSEGSMNDWDYRHEGTVGTVSVSIRPNCIGEVIFEQHGIRRSVGARSDDSSVINKGTEVVISRYEKGIAYVRRWDEFTREAS
jgi:membrane protein implicated in regulation of membrane protease activity